MSNNFFDRVPLPMRERVSASRSIAPHRIRACEIACEIAVFAHRRGKSTQHSMTFSASPA